LTGSCRSLGVHDASTGKQLLLAKPVHVSGRLYVY